MVDLGDEVKDKVSGFRGVAVAMHSYLQGCNRISVQPSVDKDGKLPEMQTFDEPMLEIIKKNKVVGQAGRQYTNLDNPPGGPEKYTDKGKTIGNNLR